MARRRRFVFGRGVPVPIPIFVPAAVMLVSRARVLAWGRGMSATAGALVTTIMLAGAATLILRRVGLLPVFELAMILRSRVVVIVDPFPVFLRSFSL